MFYKKLRSSEPRNNANWKNRFQLSQMWKKKNKLLIKDCIRTKSEQIRRFRIDDRHFRNDDRRFRNDDRRFRNDDRRFRNDDRRFRNDDRRFRNDDCRFRNDDPEKNLNLWITPTLKSMERHINKTLFIKIAFQRSRSLCRC